MNWFHKNISLEVRVAEVKDQFLFVFPNQLNSLILFGSAVKGTWNPVHSDINILCEFLGDQIQILDLAVSLENSFKKHRVNCLWFSEGRVEKSADVFPIEMLDLKLHHSILIGNDIVSSIEIHNSDLRLACERLTREKLLSLRSSYITFSGQEKLLRQLLIKSAPTWGAVFQSILYLNQVKIPQNIKDRTTLVGEVLKIEVSPFLALFEWRVNPESGNLVFLTHLYREYMKGVGTLVEKLDRWEIK